MGLRQRGRLADCLARGILQGAEELRADRGNVATLAPQRQGRLQVQTREVAQPGHDLGFQALLFPTGVRRFPAHSRFDPDGGPGRRHG
jgi:hypothetical protein